jgi:hypothetical protein
MNAEINIKESTHISKCSICKQAAYGKGCIWSPYKGIHLHLDDATKCSWCGSKNIIGKGCIYSPTGLHGIGANLYTQMTAESFFVGILMKRLSIPFNETKAYETGVINENGNRIKTPSTEQEKSSYTILDSFIFKLKKLLGVKLDMLNEDIYFNLSKDASKVNLTVEQYEKELELKRNLANASVNFYQAIEEAKKANLPQIIIDKLIVEEFSR